MKNEWMSVKSTRIFGIEFTVVNRVDMSVRIYKMLIENWLGTFFTNFVSLKGGKFVDSDVYLNVMLTMYLLFICLN